MWCMGKKRTKKKRLKKSSKMSVEMGYEEKI